MTQSIANRFIDALRKLELERDLNAITSLFAEDCEVGNIIVPEKFTGKDGARSFWTKYRDTFDEIRSTFRNQIETDDRTALEWTTQGTSVNHAPVEYEGVSILEIKDDKITRFRAYFDAGALGRQIETADMRVTAKSD